MSLFTLSLVRLQQLTEWRIHWPYITGLQYDSDGWHKAIKIATPIVF